MTLDRERERRKKLSALSDFNFKYYSLLFKIAFNTTDFFKNKNLFFFSLNAAGYYYYLKKKMSEGGRE
jgi:hypothetical protein